MRLRIVLVFSSKEICGVCVTSRIVNLLTFHLGNLLLALIPAVPNPLTTAQSVPNLSSGGSGHQAVTTIATSGGGANTLTTPSSSVLAPGSNSMMMQAIAEAISQDNESGSLLTVDKNEV